MTDELRPVRCGCGGEAYCLAYENTIRVTEDGYDHSIYCSKCHIETKLYDTEAEAIEAWNKAMGERTAKVKKGAYDLMRCECGMPVSSNYDYCPKCRARLEWE